MSLPAESPWQRQGWFSFDGFREGVVSLIFLTSFFVKIEPAPTDYLVLLCVVLFVASGLHFSRYLAPGMLFLILLLVSGIIASIPINKPILHYENTPYFYAIALALTAVSAVFLAGYVAADPSRRYLQIERAYWIGATIGAILGLLLYMQVEPFLSVFKNIGKLSYGNYYYRATGGFKDPNVFSTWLVFPLVSMLQAFMVGRLRLGLISITSFLTMLIALLLAFSRGAWIDAAAAATITIVLTAFLSPSPRQKARIVSFAIAGIAILIVTLVALLSVPSLQAAFVDRLVLVKSYDSGEVGRFGNQLNAIPLLMRQPLGFGPYQFTEIFGIAPHNTFLNAFAAGGWLGGISYLLLTIINIVYGFKAIMTRSPLQAYAIVVFSCFIVMTFQGIQIDDEHWRHLYWMMGIGWGLVAAVHHTVGAGYRDVEILDGWSLPKYTDVEGERMPHLAEAPVT